MAEWSRETPWRQGYALTDETVEKFALRDARAPEVTLVVVISHDCDLAASPDKEPEVELIVGRLIEKADGNFTHAKTPRVLHIEFATPDGGKFVELSATKKVRVAKSDFAGHEPRREFQLGPTEQSILQRWLGARYRRAAFPDAFEKRLNESGASARLTKILKPAGKHICAIFFDVDGGKEVQRNDPNDSYALTIVLLYTSQPNSAESEAVALKVREQIESVFKELFFDRDNSWRDIELLECMVMSDEALTYAQSGLLKQWRLEHLSLREDPEDPMIQE
jgi:hypothetical protein